MSNARRLPARRGQIDAWILFTCSFRHSHRRPVLDRRERGEPQTLASCYRNSLQLAVENGIKTIAFPAISCGAYRYPISEAAQIAVETTLEFLANNDGIDKVIFILANDEIVRVYERILQRTRTSSGSH